MKYLPALFLVACALPVLAENWPGWRGPRGDGTSSEKNVPVKWSGTENVLWKTPLAGGHASPIVWGERIFIVGAVAETEGAASSASISRAAKCFGSRRS